MPMPCYPAATLAPSRRHPVTRRLCKQIPQKRVPANFVACAVRSTDDWTDVPNGHSLEPVGQLVY